jgi:hypothetical protein
VTEEKTPYCWQQGVGDHSPNCSIPLKSQKFYFFFPYLNNANIKSISQVIGKKKKLPMI